MAKGDHRPARAWRRTRRCVRRLDGGRYLRGEGLLLRGRVLPGFPLPLHEWRTATGSGAKRILGFHDGIDDHRPRGRLGSLIASARTTNKRPKSAIYTCASPRTVLKTAAAAAGHPRNS